MVERAGRARRIAADLTLVGVTVFWGTSFALVKEAMETTGPANFLTIRFALALAMLLPVAYARRKTFSPAIIKPGLICGFFLFSAFLTQAVGLVYTTASRSGFITGLNVVLVPLLAIVLFKRLPSPWAMVGAALAFLGLYLFTFTDQAQGVPFNVGDVWTFVCAFFCAGHILAVGRFAPNRDAFWLTFVQFCLVVALSLLWSVAAGQAEYDLPAEVYGAGLFLALSCTVFAFWGQAWAQRFTTPTRTAIIYTLEPVFAALFAWFWLGETMGRWGVLGGGLIVAGILLAEFKPKTWEPLNGEIEPRSPEESDAAVPAGSGRPSPSQAPLEEERTRAERFAAGG